MNSYFQHTLCLSSYASHQKYKCFNKNILITFVFRIFSIYLMKFDIEFMIIKPLRRTHVRIGNG